jgi:histidinol dehydrogenase
LGQGNQFVTVAKQLATKHNVAIDMPAGPSELLVMADDSANIAFVASDLLSQAEHGADSQVILVSTSEKLLDAVESRDKYPDQRSSEKGYCRKIHGSLPTDTCGNDKVALEMINDYAPEHFIICSDNEDFILMGS